MAGRPNSFRAFELKEQESTGFMAKNYHKFSRQNAGAGVTDYTNTYHLDLVNDAYSSYRYLFINRTGLYNFYFNGDTAVANSVMMNLTAGECWQRPTRVETYTPISGTFAGEAFTFTVASGSTYDLAFVVQIAGAGNTVTYSGSSTTPPTITSAGFQKVRIVTNATTLVVTFSDASILLNPDNIVAVSCNLVGNPQPGDVIVFQ
jgi:hypothetical protein